MMLRDMTALFDRFSSVCFDAPNNAQNYNYYTCEYTVQPKSAEMPEAILAVVVGTLVILAAAFVIYKLRRKKALVKTK